MATEVRGAEAPNVVCVVSTRPPLAFSCMVLLILRDQPGIPRESVLRYVQFSVEIAAFLVSAEMVSGGGVVVGNGGEGRRGVSIAVAPCTLNQRDQTVQLKLDVLQSASALWVAGLRNGLRWLRQTIAR